MSSYDDFVNDSASTDGEVTGAVTLDEILYFGQQADWGTGRSSYLGLYKLTDNSVLLAGAKPGVSLADQDLQVWGTVESDYDPDFLENYWIAMAGWRKGSNGHDSAEGFRIVYSNGDRNGYGDMYWLQTFEFYGDNFHEDSRAISAPQPLSSKSLASLEDLHQFDINGDDSIGQSRLGGSSEVPGMSENLTPGMSDSIPSESPSEAPAEANLDIENLLAQLGGGGSTDGGNNFNINIVNNTNTGSGSITTGDISQGNTFITFTIGTINLNMNKAIYEPGRKSDVVKGTSRDDIIAAGPGKDTLIGGRGDDYFVVGSVDEDVKKRSADVIKDFRSGDQIVLDNQAYDAIGDDIEVAITDSKKELKSAAKDDAPIIYDQRKGKLFYDANGDKKGWGSGGQILKVAGKPELVEGDFSYLDPNAESIDQLTDAGVDSTPSTELSPDSADADIVPVNEV